MLNWSESLARRESVVREMSEVLGLPVKAVSASQEVIRGADVIVSATNSKVPVFDGNWLEPGQHVTFIGRRGFPK